MQPRSCGVSEAVEGVGQPELQCGLQPQVLGLPRPLHGLPAGLQRLLRAARVLLDPGDLAERPGMGGQITEPAVAAAAARQFRSASPYRPA